MQRKALALLSGGLDSMLAIRLVQEQGIEVQAVNVETPFCSCIKAARSAARLLKIPLTVLSSRDDYLEVLLKPRYGYGRGMNPCVDCHAHMFRLAKPLLAEKGASFFVSGEVIGQRMMSQKSSDLSIVERLTGLKGLIVRPLSARHLPETLPERLGILDRSRLMDIQGRSRKLQMALARQYGWEEPPSPSPGCALTDIRFARKVRDLVKHDCSGFLWEFELLRVGRHFRLSRKAKVILGKNLSENTYLKKHQPSGTVLMAAKNFPGPSGLLCGEVSPAVLQKAGSIILHYARKPLPKPAEMIVYARNEQKVLRVRLPAKPGELKKMRVTCAEKKN